MSTSTSLKLLLVRSGATDWDDASRLQGGMDLPLSDSGRQAVENTLPTAIGAEGSSVTLVLHGPDEASRRTAAVVAARTRARRRELPGLHDIDLGLWSGMLEAELLDRQPTVFRQWKEDPALVTPPEGENSAEAQERLLAALARGVVRARGTVAVVLRPLALGALRAWIKGENLASLWRMIDEAPLVEAVYVPRARLAALRTGESAGAR